MRHLSKDLERIKLSLGSFIASHAKEAVSPIDTQDAFLGIEIYVARRESVDESRDAMFRHVEARQMLDGLLRRKERRFT